MNLNVIGGALGVAALIAIFAYGQREPDSVPAPIVQAPDPVIVKALPAVPVKVPPIPRPAPIKNAIVYHRVEQGGAQGAEVSCASVKLFVEGKSPAEVATIAKQYEVTVDQVKRYYVCED